MAPDDGGFAPRGLSCSSSISSSSSIPSFVTHRRRQIENEDEIEVEDEKTH